MKRTLAASASLALLVCVTAAAQRQFREPTTAEIDSIREAFGLDRSRTSRRVEVMEVRGTYSEDPDQSDRILIGTVDIVPYEVQTSLCIMEIWHRRGDWSNSAYEWGPRDVTYWNWLRGPQEECRIANRSAVPEEYVITPAAIPSGSLEFAMNHGAEILALAYDYASTSADVEIAPNAMTKILEYRDDPAFRLGSLEITNESVPGIGIAYMATYRSGERAEGPMVVFSITEAGIVVHGAYLWMY